MLSNGVGAIDWAGLHTVAELLGFDDIDLLIRRLLVIKTHRADPEDNTPKDE